MDKMSGIAESDRTRCEIWSRVMGYYRPITSWNAGKQSEFKDRVYYHMPSGESLQETGDWK